MIKNPLYFFAPLLALSLVLTACSDNSYVTPLPSDAKTLTISVTDAPLDGVSKVIVQFSGIEIKHVDAEAQIIAFDTPVDVDLLGLAGSKRSTILLEEKIPKGDYEYLRLIVNAAQGEFDSIVILDDNTWQSLYVPDNEKIGLKILQPFSINSGRNTHLTVDFDLRKSVEKDVTEAEYQLAPSLRIVSDREAGHVKGLVSNTLLTDNACVDVNSQTNAAVYLFSAFSDGEVPQDIQRNEFDPVSSANIEFDTQTGEYYYELGFLPRDVSYSAVVVCDASIDTPSAVDALIFIGETKGVTPIETLSIELNF